MTERISRSNPAASEQPGCSPRSLDRSGLTGYGLSRLVGRITVSASTYKRVEVPLLVVPPVIICPWAVMSQLSQQVVIEQAVGPGAWDRGVRLIDDDGTLNNGARLNLSWRSLIDPGGLILAIGISGLPALVWIYSAGPPLFVNGREHQTRG